MEPPLASYYSRLVDTPITPPASPSTQDWSTDDSVFFGEPTSPWQRCNDSLEAKLSKNPAKDSRRDTLVVRRDRGHGEEGLDCPSAGGVFTRSPLAPLGSPLSRIHETPSSAHKSVLSSPLAPPSSTRRNQNTSPSDAAALQANSTPSAVGRTASPPTPDALLASPSRFSASPRLTAESVNVDRPVEEKLTQEEEEEDEEEDDEKDAEEAAELVEVEEETSGEEAELGPVEPLEKVENSTSVLEEGDSWEDEEEEPAADAGDAELDLAEPLEAEVLMGGKEELEVEHSEEEELEERDEDGWEDEVTAVQKPLPNDLATSADAEAASDVDLEHQVELDQVSASDAEPTTEEEATNEDGEEDEDGKEDEEEDEEMETTTDEASQARFSEQESVADASESEELSDTDAERSEDLVDDEESFKEEEHAEEELAGQGDATVAEQPDDDPDASNLDLPTSDVAVDVTAASARPLERADGSPPPPILSNSPPSSPTSLEIQVPSTPLLSSSPMSSTSFATFTTPSLVDPPSLDLAPSPTASVSSSTPSAAERNLPPPALAAPTAKRQLSKLTSKIAKGTRKPEIPSKIKRRSGLVAVPAAAKDTGTPRGNRPIQGRIPSTSGLPKRATPPLKPSLAMRSAISARPAFVGPPSSTSSVTSKIKASTLPSSLPSNFNRPPPSRPPISASGTSRGATLLAQRKTAKEQAELPMRPGSAASNSSASSLATSTLRRPGVLVKSSNLKPPNAAAKGGIARPAPLVRRVVPGGVPVIRAGVASGSGTVRPPSSTASTAASRPPPSSTSSISRPTSAIPSSRPAPPLAPRQASSQPLPRPSPARPSVLPRLLPLLTQTHSAPSLLHPADLHTALFPVVDVVARVPSPLLPRPVPLGAIGNAVRSEVGGKSPLKRRALRAWEVPSENERARAESENVVPRQTPSTSTALQRSVSTPALSSAVIVILTRPTPPTLLSPLKSKPLAPTPEPTTEEPPSALTAPAEKLDIGVELFAPVEAMLPRPKRTRTPTVDIEDPAPSARSTRRTALDAQLASTTPLPRPTRRQPAPIIEPEPEEPEPDVRAPILFRPAPALTAEELSQLTQKNTKRNKILFNKLDLQTVLMDTNRPPSPTSKIRRSLGAAGPTMKEDREARAAKRRSALRSSTDGSEVLLVDLELEAEGSKEGVLEGHYRAAGDEEEYRSPVRRRKSKGKKRSVAMSEGGRRVKWDRALVYEGPVEPQNEGEPGGILKNVPLDSFGNSTSTSTGFAKPACVAIRMRIYKDDE